MRKLYPLTDQEREFAEAHISLVDKFLSCKGFRPDIISEQEYRKFVYDERKRRLYQDNVVKYA